MLLDLCKVMFSLRYSGTHLIGLCEKKVRPVNEIAVCTIKEPQMFVPFKVSHG